MDSKDIVSILKACKDLNVKELIMGDLVVSFQDLTNNNHSAHNSTKTVPFNEAHEIDSVPEVDETEEVAEIMDEFTTANMMASDPVAYEKHLRDN